MSIKEPTFKERIRLLDICAHEIEVHADRHGNDQLVQKRLRSIADLVSDEAARMKLANQRWEQQRKTTPSGAVLTS